MLKAAREEAGIDVAKMPDPDDEFVALEYASSVIGMGAEGELKALCTADGAPPPYFRRSDLLAWAERRKAGS